MNSYALRFFVLLNVGLSAGPANLRAVERPNVLLMVSDDHGWPDLGCIGRKPIETPNLDRLASSGVRATSFYVTWPACTPSRGSILTGRYPLRNGLYDMIRNDMVNYGHRYSAEEYALSPEMTLGLDVREVTIGNVLKAAGYRTAVIGKWDMGQAKRFLPLQRGFDYFYGHGNNGIDYFTHERYGVPSIFRNNQRTEEDRGTYITDVFEREAAAFLKQQGDQPWFLYLCFNAPHGGSSFGDAALGEKAKVGVQAPLKNVQRQIDRGVPKNLAHYYAAVACMDESIGRLLEQIDASGATRNTLVIFLSDNGGSGNGGNAPLRGKKSTLWEGGLRVPLLASWPGTLPSGRVTDEFLTSLELFPTIVAAAGTHSPDDLQLDGFNMLPTLRGEAESPRKEMFWKRRSDRAARLGNWKWLDSEKGKGLYDLTSDLGESRDVSAKHPDVEARIREVYENWLKNMETTEPRGPFRDY